MTKYVFMFVLSLVMFGFGYIAGMGDCLVKIESQLKAPVEVIK